ncbi:L-aspartate oxidase [Sulfurospirillum sp. 1612]|uniref:L-aspartate oxidase n=1 Tax=Sulfurospirillum sp. 1612 TaxID=3094835 RepID=UPI002F95883B
MSALKQHYDVLIIGTGVAGLNTANHLDDDLDVLVISKDYAWECNTFYAQGGVAVAVDEDDIPSHIEDTLNAGAGLCDKEAVEILCHEGRDAIADFMRSGFEFDRDASGNLLYTKEAAHSRNRILHAGGDATGRYIHLHLMNQLKFPILYNTQVSDLLIEDGVCYGVRVFHHNEIFNIYAKHVVIASGGVGSLYEYHTNARTISADMQGICLSHGIALRDMEMMQFHPTVFVQSNAVRKQLLSESLRGEGAKVVDSKGKRFLFDYDARGELSPRNIVSQAIFDYQKRVDKKIFLDVSHFEDEFFMKRFPSIYFNMKGMGYNLPKDLIPISPAFHYAMGGIKCDLMGRVDGMACLYVVGESANTRVHGANRLASNSLLEGFVFSRRVAHDICEKRDDDKPAVLFDECEPSLIKRGDKELKNRLRNLMWDNVGIIREKENLEKARQSVEDMLELPTGKLLRLRLLSSREIIKSALKREKSLGAHYLIRRD